MDDLKTEVGEELAKEELEELENLGKEIDKVRDYQNWLKQPEVKKTITNDPTYILYRLPLTDTQRQKIFEAMKKENPDEFTSLQE